MVDVNLKGPFLCSLAVLPAMRERRAGTLIHVVSNAATGIFSVSGPAYTASKHGARAMSATLNAEEGIHGIRSICINPGEVATPILDKRPKPPSAEDRASWCSRRTWRPPPCSPPAPLRALQHLPHVPTVIFSTQAEEDITPLDDYATLMRNGGLTGTSQISGTFAKMGRPFDIVVGSIAEERPYCEIARLARVHDAFARLRRLQIGMLGHVFPGMYDLEVDRTRLRGSLGPNGFPWISRSSSSNGRMSPSRNA